MTRAPRRIAAGALVAPLLVLGACGADDSADSAATTTVAAATASGLPAFDAEQRLPPNDVGSLRDLYDPVLADFGVRLTRGALVDTSDGRYVPSNDGRHLALYVEPLGDYSTDQYVAGFWTISALMTPDVFARWPELESYDICQEPRPGEDDDPEPFPITQVNVTREAAAQIDWADGDLVDLLVASRTKPDVKVIVTRELRQHPGYAAADAAARTKAGGSATTTSTP